MLQIIKMRALRATFVLAVCALMLVGCGGSRESKLAGQWKMDASAMAGSLPQGKTPQEKMGMEMAKSMFDKMTLDLKEDKTFAMNMLMEFSGNWTLDESANTITLNMTKMGDTDISKMPNAGQAQQPMVLNVSADNQTLTMAAPGAAATASAGTMKFVKVK